MTKVGNICECIAFVWTYHFCTKRLPFRFLPGTRLELIPSCEDRTVGHLKVALPLLTALAFTCARTC
jgi:hypothetical protein